MTNPEGELKNQAQALIEENFSSISAEYVEELWLDILEFINDNDYVTTDDFLKVMELLRNDEAYEFVSPRDEVIEESHHQLEDELDFDEVGQALLPEELDIDHTAESHEQDAQRQAQQKTIIVKEEVMEQTENYLQDDLVTLILHDVNELVEEARSKSLENSISGLNTQDPHYLDKMIAQAPHAVVKGTLKALYQHVSGMYQNLVYGSEIYPDEAGFTGAVKDILADKSMIHGQEPWQVKFGPNMAGGGRRK